MAVAGPIFIRQPFVQLALAIQGLYLHQFVPGFAAVAARVHGDGTADGAGNASPELAADEIVVG